MKETIAHLDFIISHSEESIKHFEGHDVDGIPYFCLGLLERLHASAKGLKVLLEKVESDPFLEYSAGLIIRTSLLDFLTVLKAYDIQGQGVEKGEEPDETKAALELYCNEVLADGLDNTLNYIRDLKSVGSIIEDDMRRTFANLAKNYPMFIEEYDGGDQRPTMKFRGEHSGKKLFKALSQRPMLKELAKLYDTYLWFSKYDHFSILSYDVIRQDQGEKLERLRNAVKQLALHNFIICSLLKDFLTDEFTLGQHKSSGYLLKSRRVRDYGLTKSI